MSPTPCTSSSAGRIQSRSSEMGKRIGRCGSWFRIAISANTSPSSASSDAGPGSWVICRPHLHGTLP